MSQTTTGYTKSLFQTLPGERADSPSSRKSGRHWARRDFTEEELGSTELSVPIKLRSLVGKLQGGLEEV